jgi:hypothetical protein
MEKLFNLFMISCCLLQSDTFQEDLFPDTAAPTPAVSAQDWINGRNCNPVLMSLNTGKEQSLNVSHDGQRHCASGIWKGYIPLKCHWISTEVHGVTTQKIMLLKEISLVKLNIQCLDKIMETLQILYTFLY